MDPDSVRAVGRVPHGGSDDPDLLEFSANTNPKTPDGVEEVYADALDASRSYPNDDYPEFRAAAAEFAGVEDSERVVPTPGGLAALRLAFATSVAPGDSVLVPYPSFGEYAREVRLQGGDPEFVPAAEVLDADPAGRAAAVVCNPNNPTGRAYDEALRAFAAECRDADCLLVVDEAFLGFTDRPSLADTEGVVVARSLTKLFGLPGLRAGFAVGVGEEREALETARRAWNLGTPAAAVGAHCLRDGAFVAETRERVRRERARMADALGERFEVHPSEAPYLLVDVGERDPGAVVAAARERGIAIRDATTFRGLDSHVRVAVRLPEENDRLLAVMRDV
ncbi:MULTISPECIES: aminotransferase class I/II-fold pyridoxal phosphate-dependent enzyme [Halorussus]|uniref:aminotransferase class I/II-fold pyridoxal phosphate-dependent enzyme n=1 Tax=Halorussus TaxID=1070314 RepID=UPI00209C8A11|nr:aminotransferase class I/II-fold pyridoxal phosphate-dependent enzyme [Halorussus vallis]USZ75045.1 aminotransferase class I/II-fold pyridoxal phosphate-dependent enzyme [Halorussus vallis]